MKILDPYRTRNVDLSLYYKLTHLDASVQILGQESAWEARMQMHAVLRSSMPFLPKLPMAHGRGNDYIWNYFPDQLSDQFFTEDMILELATYERLVVVHERVQDGVYLLSGRHAAELARPGYDRYIMPYPEMDWVWVVDHEGFGPWRIAPGKRIRLTKEERANRNKWYRCNEPEVLTADQARAYLARISPVHTELPLAKLGRVKREVRQELRGRIDYLPEYRLPQESLYWDYFWNYIPAAHDFCWGGDCGQWALAGSDEVLLHFEKRGLPGFILKTADLSLEDLVPEHLYLLDWPKKRWLMALPKEVIERGEESSRSPSYVRLDGWGI